MTRYFLVLLRIEGFRGINNSSDPLELKFKSNAVNSIFGPNGLGKSSIYDALSFAIRGSIPKLEELPQADAPKSYYSNRFHQTGTSTIELTFESDNGGPNVEIRIVRSPKGQRTVVSPTGHSNPEQFLKDLDSEFVLLDQNTFQRFVADSPLQRGRTFSGLLGLAKLSEYRQVLQTLSHRRTLDTDFEIKTLSARSTDAQRERERALLNARMHYKSITGNELPDSFSPHLALEQARISLKQFEVLKPHFAEPDLSRVDFAKVNAALRLIEKSDLREELTLSRKSLDTCRSLCETESEVIQQMELRTKIDLRDALFNSTHGPLLPPVYQSALRVLESPDWNERICPACETLHDTPLAPEIEKRQTEYADVARCQKEIAACWQASSWSRRLRNAEDCVECNPLANDNCFQKIDRLFCEGTGEIADLDRAIARLKTLGAKLEERIDAINKRIAEIEQQLPRSLVALSQKIYAAEQLVAQIQQYVEQDTNHSLLSDKLRKRTIWIQFIESASSRFSEAEVSLSTRKTIAIENDYQQMYAGITNNPSVIPKLRRASGTEDLHLRLDRFYGLKDVSATTLLQESYRNALAISIFLSTAIQSATPGRFIILDDVTSSFDAGHQFALMELLRQRVARPEHLNGPQIILLSHDGLLEKYFDKLSGTVAWHHQKLQGLPPHGTVLSQVQNADRLRHMAEKFLASGQCELALPLIRQYLEYRLLKIIRSLGISVPLDFAIRDDRKMVENAVTAIKDAVRLHQMANSLILDRTQVNNLTSVVVPALLGNWVSHYATGITNNLSVQVLMALFATIDQFADCFQYDCRCSGGVKRRDYRSLSQKACGC
jgi:DNA repair exonuclease SbcCD ATPase subunit